MYSMRLTERIGEWELRVGGFTAAALPIALTVDPQETIEGLTPMIISLFQALLPLILVFILFGWLMQSMGRMTRRS